MSDVKLTPRKILSDLGNKSEPDSPTANLRLLTNLATRLRNCQTDTSKTKTNDTRNNQYLKRLTGKSTTKVLPRKEKSLGLLCKRFLELYPLIKQSDDYQEISLDNTAKKLGTEKRRIYDIINVLESLEMAIKVGKNRYIWHGQAMLLQTLLKLRSVAVKIGMRNQVHESQRANKAFNCRPKEVAGHIAALNPNASPAASSTPHITEDKSLGTMCQKFIMLFLASSKDGVINLDMAAKILITELDQSSKMSHTEVRSRFKTKVRRLYDIANILTMIGLIKKVSLLHGAMRKPIFQYAGPDLDSYALDTETPNAEISTKKSRVGLATPNKKRSRAFNAKTLCTEMQQTPTKYLSGVKSSVAKSQTKKRKLFECDSSNSMQNGAPFTQMPSKGVDQSILEVAEMELKRLNRMEEKSRPSLVELEHSYHVIMPKQSTITEASDYDQGPASEATTSNAALDVSHQPVNPSGCETIVLNSQASERKVLKIDKNVINEQLSNAKTPGLISLNNKTYKLIKLPSAVKTKLVPIKTCDLKLPLTICKPSLVDGKSIFIDNGNLTNLKKVSLSNDFITPGKKLKFVALINSVSNDSPK